MSLETLPDDKPDNQKEESLHCREKSPYLPAQEEANEVPRPGRGALSDYIDQTVEAWPEIKECMFSAAIQDQTRERCGRSMLRV